MGANPSPLSRRLDEGNNSYTSPSPLTKRIGEGSPNSYISPSPLANRPGDGTTGYNPLRSSLERTSPGNSITTPRYSGEIARAPSGEGPANDRMTNSFRKSYLDDAEAKSNGRSTADINIVSGARGDHSSYRKSLLSEYRNTLGTDSNVNPARSSENGIKDSGGPATRHSHHQTPQATETSTYSSSTTQQQQRLRDQKQSNTGSSVRGSSQVTSSSKTSAAPAARSHDKMSVFNYEGGDRAGSRNHMHMMMNHNLMNAHQPQDSETSKKKVGNLKKARKKITVNLQGTRYDVGMYHTLGGRVNV